MDRGQVANLPQPQTPSLTTAPANAGQRWATLLYATIPSGGVWTAALSEVALQRWATLLYATIPSGVV